MKYVLWGIVFISCTYRNEIKIITKTENENPKTVKEVKEVKELEEWPIEPKASSQSVYETESEKESRAISLEKAQNSRKHSTKKKKVIPLFFSGDEFIRELIPNRDPKEGTIITIKGNAQFKRLKQSLFADKIEIFGEDGAYVRGTGNLRFFDAQHKMTVKAQVAEFYKWQNQLILKGQPQAEWLNQDKSKSYLLCQEWERYFDKKVSYCKGNVKFQKENLSIYSQKAEFQEEKKTITLLENPLLFQDTHIVTAEKLVFSQEENTEKVFAQKAVKIYHGETQKDKKVVTSIIEADEATLEKSEKLYLGQKITILGNPVTLRRRDFFVKAKKAEIWGENAQEIFLWQSVYLENQKDGSYLVGENFRFFRLLGLAKMESETKNGKKIRPKGYFFSQKKDEKAIVEAESFERNIFRGRIQARGDVHISYEGSKENAIIKGEWAEVIEEKELLTVNGNPSLKQESGEVFAKQILVFYREKRYELLGPLHGSLNLTQ